MPKQVDTLKKTAEFQKIFDEGEKVFAQNLGIYYLRGKALRIGIVISKKQGPAVKRNRTRRLVKEFFCLNQEKISPASIIIIAKEPLVDAYFDTEQIMLKLLRKAGLMR